MSDGKVVIGTGLDNSGLKADLGKLQALITGSAAAIGAAVAATTAMIVTMGSAYETSMAKASTLFGDTNVNTQKLDQSILSLSNSSGKAATELNEALYQAMSAGVPVTEDMGAAVGFVDQAVKLATGGFTTSASAVDVMSTAINAYGLEASDAAKISDLLITVQNKGKTTVDELSGSLGRVLPVASAFSVSLEDVGASEAKMTASGIATAEATTYLKSMLNELGDSGSVVGKVLQEKTGMSFAQLMESGKSLGDVMQILTDSVNGDTTAFSGLWSSQEAGVGALALANGGAQAYNDTLDAMKNSTGATDDAYSKMSDTLEFKTDQMMESAKNLAISVYNDIQEPLKDAADVGIDCFNRLAGALETGGVNGVVKEAGELFEDLTDKVAESSNAASGIITPLKQITENATGLAKTALPPTIKAMGLVAKNATLVASTVAAGYTAMKTYALVSKAVTTATTANAAANKVLNAMERANALQLVATNGGLTARQTLLGIYNGQISITTAATGLWAKAQTTVNMAMTANPIGLVVAGLAALVVGIGIYKIATGDAANNTKLFSDEEEALNKRISDTAESLAEAKKAREENINGILQESAYTESLLDELKSICDENGNVKEGYEARASYITSVLSDALGIEIELVDGQIQKYGELVGAIDATIQKKKAEAVLQAYEADYQEAIKNRTSAMQDLVQVSDEYADAQSELSTAEKEQKEYISENGVENAKLTNTIDALRAKTSELKDKFDESKSSYEEYNNTIATYEGLSSAIIEGDSQKIQDTLIGLQTNFKYFGQATDEELKNQAITASDNMALLSDAIKTGVVNATDGAVTEFANMSAKSLGELAKLPGGAAGIASEIDPAMLGQLAVLSGSLNDESKAAVSSFLEGLNGVDEDTRKKFEQAVQGAIEGSEFGNEVSEKATEMGGSYLDALREVLQVHSPSRAVKEIFAQTVPGAVEGVDEGKEGLIGKGMFLVSEFLDGMQSTGGNAQSVGASLMNLFGMGINSQAGNSKSAGQANALAAQSGAGSVNPSGTGSLFSSIFSDGISGAASRLTSAGMGVANAAKNAAGTINPSSVGALFSSTFGAGITGASGSASSAASSMAKSSKTALDAVSTTSSGKFFGSGFAEGISSMIGNAVDSARNLASSALSAIKKALDINSPSKKAYSLGEFTGEGFENALLDKIRDVKKAGAKFGNAALSGIDIGTVAAKMKASAIEANARFGASVTSMVLAQIEYNQGKERSGEQGTIVQNVSINQPVKSPIETAREIRKVGKELAFG